MPLFQTDFRNGVAVLNRMLNHAALARARTLAGLGQPFGAPSEGDPLDEYRTELNITRSCRKYIGDEHVWLWYRGTGVGPYACMSALQALERVCDQIIEIGFPVAELVPMLLDGCENLAMVGMVVGLLVRHLESAGRLLDPFLAEPMVWHNEFTRVVHEHGGLRAPSDGLVAPERRGWSVREAVMTLVLRSDDGRSDELREIGERLVAAGRSLVLQADGTDAATLDEHLAPVRAWASALDRGTYEATATDEGVLIQSRPPADVVHVLEPGNVDIQRAQESTRLMLRYDANRRGPAAEPFAADQLVADLAIAEDLLINPRRSARRPATTRTDAVAAQALESRLLDDLPLPDDAVAFALETVLQVAKGAPSARQHEFEESFLELGADRSAARVIGLLLTPAGADMRSRLNNNGADERGAAAGSTLARATANETRVHLARGLDRLWRAPCAPGSGCPHEIGLRLLVESMRDSAFGGWDPETGTREVLTLTDPVPQALTATPGDAIYVSRVDGAIRGLAPAAATKICVSGPARELLDVVLAAQRRALLSHERNLDHRGTHALIAARALLTLARDGDDAALFEHIDAYADNSNLLGGLLRAASAAAEETTERAATARRLWPTVIEHVLDLLDAGHTPFSRRHWGDYTLASLLPNHAGEVAYLYPETREAPIRWWDVLLWTEQIQRWLSLARGNPTCVDHLIGAVRPLPEGEQATTGLLWLADLVLADPAAVAGRSFLTSSWLIDIRTTASEAGLGAVWQQVVDALVVAGATRLAPYSE